METTAVPEDAQRPTRPRRPRRFYPRWIPQVLVRPREAFRRIVGERRGVWQAAILLLTVTAVLRVLATGYVQQQTPGMGETLPPDFEFWSPEQQQQFMQASQLTGGPVFNYVLPALQAVGGVWFGWLVVGGVLHLLLTLLGGRTPTITTMNIVAWARLPFAVRDVVRTVAALAGDPVTTTGLAGFAPPEAAGGALFLSLLLAFVDIYLIWQIVLIVLGVRTADSTLGAARTWLFTTLGVVALLLARVGISYGLAQLGGGGGGMIRPFFF